MSELDAFERSLDAAFRAFAERGVRPIDAVAFADRVAAEPRRDAGWIRPGPTARLAWIALLTAALLAGLLGAGLLAGRLGLDLGPRTPLHGSAVQVLAGDALGYDVVVADGDGTHWAIGTGRLTRFDPVTGRRTTWTVGDDAAFSGFIAGPARSGGVWVWSPSDGYRRFDGVAFRESIPSAGDEPFRGGGGWTVPHEPEFAVATDGTLWSLVYLRYWDGSAWTALPGKRPELQAYRQLAFGRAPNEVWVADSNFGWGEARISHFDGRAWSSTELRDVIRLALVTTGDGTPRAATSDGRFLRFDQATWVDAEAPGFPIWDIAVAGDGAVWAVSSEAGAPVLARYDGAGWTRVVSTAGSAGTATGRLSVTAGGVFLPTSEGLQRLEADRWVPAWPDAGPAPSSWAVAAPVSGGEAWFADAAVWHLVNGSWESISVPEQIVPAGTVASSVAVGPDGTAWVSGEGGVASLSGGTWRRVEELGEAHSVAVAGNGTLWASFGRGAVAAVSPDPSIPVQWLDCTIGPSMAVASDGTVYLSGTGGLARIVGSTCVWLDVLGGGQAYESNGVVAGPRGRLLASVGDTTRLFDGARWAVVADTALGTASDPIYFFDGQGQLWRLPWSVAGGSRSLARFDGSEWVAIEATHPWAALTSMPGIAPTWVSVADDGSLWFGWETGAARIAAAR